jgi:hypothetical protein
MTVAVLGVVALAAVAGTTAATAAAGGAGSLIVNNATRLDEHGRPLNAHQGSMIRGVGNYSGRYYLYGDWFRACKPQGFGCR